MTPFVVGSISALLSSFIALIASIPFDRQARREAPANARLPWPFLLLKPEVWGLVIGTVLMVLYLRTPDHRHLIFSALIGALTGVTYAAGILILVWSRRRKAQRVAQGTNSAHKDVSAVP